MVGSYELCAFVGLCTWVMYAALGYRTGVSGMKGGIGIVRTEQSVCWANVLPADE
jgi:hypothetical protein